MALPVLDGNQSATTLSSVVTGGEHIVAHSVVCLGSTAIANITNAVSGSVVSISNFPSTQTVAGTVTANAFGLYGGFGNIQLPIIGFDDTIEGAINGYVVPVQISNASGTIGGGNPLPISGTVTVGNSVTIGSLPNGALTTRFGSVATANLAFVTSAVTNTSRKYLLAQNISAGTVTIGIGFSPTTTQGIQLTAGAGLTFDSFCPTGAVFWLGAVTGANYCLIEG